MKITMKKLISVVTVAVLTLAFGMVYAASDEVSFMNNKDTGTELYNAFMKNEESIGSGSATGGVRVEEVIRPHDTSDEVSFMNTKDTGAELYEAHMQREADIAKGSSAGGVRAKDASRADDYTSDTIPRLTE